MRIKIKTSQGQEARTRPFSGDLSKTVGERRLLEMVLEAVQTLDAQELRNAGGRLRSFRPQMMVTLLTYCYATSLFGSQDIEMAIGSDSFVRYICARTYPGWQEIRGFRRQYREAIRKCLVQVLRQLAEMKSDAGEADCGAQAWLETDFLEQLHSAAKQRLDTAALMDGAESD